MGEGTSVVTEGLPSRGGPGKVVTNKQEWEMGGGRTGDHLCVRRNSRHPSGPPISFPPTVLRPL